MKRNFIVLHGFRFRCAKVVDGIPIDPVLPPRFDDTDNQKRPERHLAWWDQAFIQIYHDDHPKFIEHWKGNTRYDVRCLDGGAWDRPTCWGQFPTLEGAIICAKAGPTWRTPRPRTTNVP